jgi:hypothetical protein
MPRKLPPHVERNCVKGHIYLYFRLGKGPRIRLPSDPTSTEFREAYAAAMAGGSPPEKTVLKKDVVSTIGALIASYMKTGQFTRLRKTSKAEFKTANRLRIDGRRRHSASRRSPNDLDPGRFSRREIHPEQVRRSGGYRTGQQPSHRPRCHAACTRLHHHHRVRPPLYGGRLQWLHEGCVERPRAFPWIASPTGCARHWERRLADAGVSAHDIMAALGHKTLVEAERYTREADRRRGGQRAVTQLNDHKANGSPQTAPERLGKEVKTGGKSG